MNEPRFYSKTLEEKEQSKSKANRSKETVKSRKEQIRKQANIIKTVLVRVPWEDKINKPLN